MVLQMKKVLELEYYYNLLGGLDLSMPSGLIFELQIMKLNMKPCWLDCEWPKA